MIDLNNPDTYSIQDYGGGNILYQDTSTGAVYDPSDLSTPLTATQIAQYGSVAGSSGATALASTGATPTQSSLNAPAATATVSAPSSGGVSTAGMTGMFTAIGSAFASVINPPKTTTTGTPLVYDAVRGAYVPASSVGASVSNISSIPMWLVIGGVAIVAILVLTRKKG